MISKILVPTDFSESSKNALEVAASIAREHNAELVLLHMMGMAGGMVSKSEQQEVFKAMYYMRYAEQQFSELLEEEYLKGLKVTDTVHNYTNFNEINGIAQDMDVDLIVMGSHGATGLKEVFVGSNTEKVVRTSEVPVLVIKHKLLNFTPKLGVFACDFETPAIGPYKRAKRLFDLLGIEMQLLYINLAGDFRSTREIEKRIMKFMTEAGEKDPLEIVNKVVQYNDYSVESGIFAYSQVINADLIALPTQGRQGLAHFFSGSIGEDVVNHSDLPVMTFRI